MDIVNIISKPKLIEDQKVLALRITSINPKYHVYFKSSRLIDVEKLETTEHSFNKINRLVQKQKRDILHKEGRANNYKEVMYRLLC